MSIKKTPRTTLGRLPDRGSHDKETIYAILDAGIVCHVAFNIDGKPSVIPTGYARVGDTLYLHGSAASRMLRELSKEIPMCLAVTHLDGMVLARSAFHHSMNYRSVIVYGTAKLIEDEGQKRSALDALVEHLVPGRTQDARGANEIELKATTVLALSLNEASAKIRTGPPSDDEEDLTLPIWAGVIPLRTTVESPVDAPDLATGIEAPEYARGFRAPGEID